MNPLNREFGKIVRPSNGISQFEKRKKDHLRMALDVRSQNEGLSGLSFVRLIHEALPDLNFDEIDLSQVLFSKPVGKKKKSLKLASPIFVSSMTAGHSGAAKINESLARQCYEKSWAMAVGSQRRELLQDEGKKYSEWANIRKKFPGLILFGNLGLTQVIGTPIDKIKKIVEDLNATALFIHLNSLQECLQPEGTPQFRGGLDAMRELVSQLSVPVILKEVGCGFSVKTLSKLRGLGIAAVDISGLGGTHWGKVEGLRSKEGSLLSGAAQTFGDWGIPTVKSLSEAVQLKHRDFDLWGSGGVRQGLDVAKLIALGARMVGMAQPFLKASMKGEKNLRAFMDQIEFELKVALFCTGCRNLKDLQSEKVWEWT